MTKSISEKKFAIILSRMPSSFAEQIIESLNLNIEVPHNKYIEQEIKGYIYNLDHEYESKPDILAKKLAIEGNTYILDWLKGLSIKIGVTLNYTDIITAATARGHLSVITWALQSLAESYNIEYDEQTTPTELFKEVSKADNTLDILKFSKVAAATEHLYIFELLYPLLSQDDLLKVSEVAGFFGRYRSIKWILDKKVAANHVASSAVIGASLAGRDRLIKYIESLGYNINYNMVAVNAATTGHVMTVKWAIKQGANNYSDIADAGATTAHKKIIETAIEDGFTDIDGIIKILMDRRQYDLVVYFAKNSKLKAETMKLLEKLPSEIAGQIKNVKGNEYWQFDIEQWFETLVPLWTIFPEKLAYKLAAHGNLFALNVLFGVSKVKMDYTDLAYIALKYGHFDVFKFIEDYTNNGLDYTKLLFAVVESGRTALLDRMGCWGSMAKKSLSANMSPSKSSIKKCKITEKGIYTLAIAAGENGRRDVYDWILNNLQNINKAKLLNKFLKGAALSGRVLLIEKMCSEVTCDLDYQKIADIGAYTGYYTIVKFAEEKSNNLDYNRIAIAAASAGNVQIVKREIENYNVDIYKIFNVLAKRYNFDQIISIMQEQQISVV